MSLLGAAALCLLASCAAKKEALAPPPPPPPRVEVVKLQMATNREFVGVRFRLVGADRFDPAATEMYLVDEASGEKFSVVRLQRIGRLAEFAAPGEKGVHYILFRNRDGKLKVGSRVTVVVGNARQEHVPVEP